MELTHHDITEFRELLARKQEEQTDRIVEAIEQNTDKLQELLERVECIDNTLDDMKENTAVPELLQKIITQGRP